MDSSGHTVGWVPLHMVVQIYSHANDIRICMEPALNTFDLVSMVELVDRRVLSLVDMRLEHCKFAVVAVAVDMTHR